LSSDRYSRLLIETPAERRSFGEKKRDVRDGWATLLKERTSGPEMMRRKIGVSMRVMA
jgi:hypothetical protein